MNDQTGIFKVDSNSEIEVDYLFDGGWFRGEIGVFSLEGFALRDSNSDGLLDLEITFSKSSLRNVVDVDSEPFVSQQQIYLFGSSSSFEGGFFSGIEKLQN